MGMPNKFFLFPSCLNLFPVYHRLPVLPSSSGLACQVGSFLESNTMKFLYVSLQPNDLNLFSRAPILFFPTLLLLAWISWTAIFFAESPSSQCRCPVRLQPFYLMGSVPTDCQMSLIQLAMCLVKMSDTPTCCCFSLQVCLLQGGSLVQQDVVIATGGWIASSDYL